MCPVGATRPLGSRTYTNPRGVLQPRIWNLVEWVNGVSTNYITFPLNAYSVVNNPSNLPKEVECAQGLTPGEYFTRSGRTWNTGGYMATLYGRAMPAWNGRLLQDAYCPVGGSYVQFWTHKGGTNILYYDGHVRWVRDFRGTD